MENRNNNFLRSLNISNDVWVIITPWFSIALIEWNTVPWCNLPIWLQMEKRIRNILFSLWRKFWKKILLNSETCLLPRGKFSSNVWYFCENRNQAYVIGRIKKFSGWISYKLFTGNQTQPSKDYSKDLTHDTIYNSHNSLGPIECNWKSITYSVLLVTSPENPMTNLCYWRCN